MARASTGAWVRAVDRYGSFGFREQLSAREHRPPGPPKPGRLELLFFS